MKVRPVFLGICLAHASALGGCATVVRGASSSFTVITKPSGATVITSVETIESRKQYDWRERKAALKNGPMPDFAYYTCQPTPCSMDIPKRRAFSMLILKEGYEPVIAAPQRTFDKKAKKKARVKAGAGTAAAAATTAGVAASAGTAMGTGAFAISTGAALAALAIVAIVPTTLVVASASETDKRTGAYFDFTPNPMIVPLSRTEKNQVSLEKIVNDFQAFRNKQSIDPVESGMCYIGNKQVTCREMQQINKRQAKAARRN